MKKLTAVFDSLKSAAAGLDVSEAFLKKLKADPRAQKAFRGSRIYAAELAPFLKDFGEHEGDDKHKLECRKLRLQCERLEFAFDSDRKKYWLRAECEAWLVGKISRARAVLKRRLAELPPHLEGLRAPAIAEHFIELEADIVEAWRSETPADDG